MMKIIENTETKPDTGLVAGIGFFDGVHQGHRSLIRQIIQTAQETNRAAAVITFPIHPREILQANFCPQLLNSYSEKLEKLAETGLDYCVSLDFTLELAKLSAKDFLDMLHSKYRVECLYIGYDHRFGHNRTDGSEQYKEYGKQLGIEIIQSHAYAPKGEHISSSVIRSLIKNGSIIKARELLTYPYPLKGLVVEGQKIGRKIGFPTANLMPVDSRKLIPACGVYAVKVKVDNQIYGGMLNIGHRPTVQTGDQLSIEVNLFDFADNLYGKTIELLFFDYLRPERKMSGLDELIEQLKKDKEHALNILLRQS